MPMPRCVVHDNGESDEPGLVYNVGLSTSRCANRSGGRFRWETDGAPDMTVATTQANLPRVGATMRSVLFGSLMVGLIIRGERNITKRDIGRGNDSESGLDLTFSGDTVGT